MDRTIGGTVRTQYRTWVYSPATLLLLSQTSPEAGMVSYTYNTDGTLATVTDAKSQRKVFTYDSYGRITQIARGTVSGGVFTEIVAQRTTYTYSGTNGGFSSATAGRVSQIGYTGPHGLAFTEWYSYHKAGAIVAKRLTVAGTPFGSSALNLDADYTLDNNGNVSAVQYPNSQFNSNNTTVSGPGYTYGYDTRERLLTMADKSNNTLVSNTTYGPSNEMLQLTASTFTETSTYNANLELTELTSGANVHYKYNYSATQDNGQILSQNDVISGETIAYQYDTLKRLISANASGDPHGPWSQNFTIDGFGNLNQITGSNCPSLSVGIDYTTNRIQSSSAYDANGNMTGYSGSTYAYDVENRMTQSNPASGGTVFYGYDSTNQRVYKGLYNGSTYSGEEIYFYGAEGHKYGTWQINPSTGVLLQASVTKQWFGNRLVSPQDRLDSRGKYFPFGQERTNVTPVNPPNDQEKFASYTRDSATGLDYADQRYYNNLIGRFMRPDPFGQSANPNNPQTWNRYAYVGNDPANNFDPSGLDDTDGTFEYGDSSPDGGGDQGGSAGPVPATRPGCPVTVDGGAPDPIPVASVPIVSFGTATPASSGATSMASSSTPLIFGLPDPTICNLPAGTAAFPNSLVQQDVTQTTSFYNNYLFNSTTPEQVESVQSVTAGFLTAQFAEGGPWDYKSNYAYGDPQKAAAQDLGNFTFGAVTAALGFTYYETQNAAGIAQIAICTAGGACGTGIPFAQYPYGDQVSDAQVIQRGYNYEVAKQAGQCP